MDDYGNDYQTEDWFMGCLAYGHSMATFGWLDEISEEIGIRFCVNTATQNI